MKKFLFVLTVTLLGLSAVVFSAPVSPKFSVQSTFPWIYFNQAATDGKGTSENAPDTGKDSQQIPLIENFLEELAHNITDKWNSKKKDVAALLNVRQVSPSLEENNVASEQQEVQNLQGNMDAAGNSVDAVNNAYNVYATPSPIENAIAPPPSPVYPFSPYLYPAFNPFATWKLQMQMAKAQMGAALAAMNITTTPKPTKPPKPTKIKFKMVLPPGSGFPPGSFEFQ